MLRPEVPKNDGATLYHAWAGKDSVHSERTRNTQTVDGEVFGRLPKHVSALRLRRRWAQWGLLPLQPGV
eukprot:10032994-Alexandrium_andersonii.AAC.1